jgi:hypothetical protein
MDVRAFFGKIAPKTETAEAVAAEIRTNARGNPCMDCLRKTGGKMVVGVTYGTCKECAGKLQRFYEKPPSPPEGLEWSFECSLRDLIAGDKVMSAHDEESGGIYTRAPTEEERAQVIHAGKQLRFLVDWTMKGCIYEVYTISEKEWAAGKRWTMDEFLKAARWVYTKNKGRALRGCGDHQFFEDIGEDGTIWLGS